MVRVISVHHFTSQDVSSIPKPVAATIAGDYLLISTENNHHIQVHDLKKHTCLSHTFQTIDKTLEVIYSAVGNYVITLEGQRSYVEDQESQTAVRAYMNWDDPKVDGAPIRPRIATRVSPSLQPSPVYVFLPHLQFDRCKNLIFSYLNIYIYIKLFAK